MGGSSTVWSPQPPGQHGRFSGTLSPKTEYQGARENLALTERLTRIDAKTVRYEVTVSDPTTFTKPWTFRADMEKRDDYENGL